jgi:nifR3 family TIM-barrel protein
MEGVGDRAFRKAITSVGGCDEAVTDFIRVPSNAHVQSLARRYDPLETHPTPLAAQLMGSDPSLMAAMACEIALRGAPRIDLNCGCPSNTVTGRGAGSSLLKDPSFLYQNASAMVQAVKIPVTIKMRSGFEDTGLFKENLLAAQESGVRYITLHPRTKADGYGPPANWDLIAEAKSILKIPIVGNGDILTVDDALRMYRTTNCDALMIGRGSIINPFIFHQIKAYFAGKVYAPPKNALMDYLRFYQSQMVEEMTERSRINKMKQLLSFLFKGTPELLERRQSMLQMTVTSFDDFMQQATLLLQI